MPKQTLTLRTNIVLITMIMVHIVWSKVVYAGCEAKIAGVNCAQLGTITETDGGIFSMKSFGDTLYLGMFGYHHKYDTNSDVSMMYQYRNGRIDRVPKTREPHFGENKGIEESVYVFEEFNGQLYASTEDDGHLYRLENDNWKRVFDSGYRGGFNLIKYQGYLYALFSNHHSQTFEIRRSSSGNPNSWSQVKTGDGYMKDLVVYQSKLYAFSVDGSQRHYWVTSNGTSWARYDAPARFYESFVCGNTLWLSSSNNYQDGFTAAGGLFNAGIWEYKNGSFIIRYKNNGFPLFKDIVEINGTLVASASRCFKNECVNNSRDAALFASFNGGDTWVKIASFNEESVFALQIHNGELYAGTMQYESTTNGYGRLYRITVPSGSIMHCNDVNNDVNIVPIIGLLLLDEEE